MEKIGRYPQFTLIISFVMIAFLSYKRESIFADQMIHKVISVMDLCGGMIFIYCLYELYTRKSRLQKLITDGVFKYTRHPMYTGLLFMGISIGSKLDYSNLLHIFSFSLFLFMLCAAGYAQEKETLARFGEKAEAYYRKTPRIFLLYQLMRS